MECWRSILFYAPLPEEPDIWPLLNEAIDAGIKVLLPRMNTANENYEAAELTSLADDLSIGSFGVREPAAHCRVGALDAIEAVLVPGVAFDGSGHRLGRGAGYYDRILSEVRGEIIGIAFDWQIIEEVPVETHDALVDRVVAPTRYFVREKTRKNGGLTPPLLN